MGLSIGGALRSRTGLSIGSGLSAGSGFSPSPFVPAGGGSYLLLDDGGYLLLEQGGRMLLDNQPVPAPATALGWGVDNGLMWDFGNYLTWG